MRKKIVGIALMRHALCALLSCRGAAAGESSADWVSVTSAGVLAVRASCRSVSARAARAWLRRGKNIVIEFRYAEGKNERVPSLRPNWCNSRLMFLSSLSVAIGPSGQAGHQDDPDCYGVSRRSSRDWVNR